MRVERHTGAFAEIHVLRQTHGIGNGVVSDRRHGLRVRERRRHHESGSGTGNKTHECTATHCPMLRAATARAKQPFLLAHLVSPEWSVNALPAKVLDSRMCKANRSAQSA